LLIIISHFNWDKSMHKLQMKSLDLHRKKQLEIDI
jgi:hypothetical protein